MADTLLIEPFYGGSHRQLVDLLTERLPSCDKFTLPAKKWHWRARTSALYFSQIIPKTCENYKILFASSVLNLAELVALRPDLNHPYKILYFHEHQLAYPIRKQQERDFQYGYNQVISCLVADQVLFNSKYCMESFLKSISSFMKLIPDHRPSNLKEQIRPKCNVLHFPIVFPNLEEITGAGNTNLKVQNVFGLAETHKIDLDSESKKLTNLSESVSGVDVSNNTWKGQEPSEVSDTCDIDPNNEMKELTNASRSSSGCNFSCINMKGHKLQSGSLEMCYLGHNSGPKKLATTSARTSVEDTSFAKQSVADSPQTIGDDDSSGDGLTCSQSQLIQCSITQTSLDERSDIEDTSPDHAGVCLHTSRNKEHHSFKHAFENLHASGHPEIPYIGITEMISDERIMPSDDNILSAVEKVALSKKDFERPENREPALHIVWPHRWEHDKNPTLFFFTLYKLADMGLDFRLSVLGEQFSEWPGIFHDARDKLSDHIEHWGYQASKQDYYRVLIGADIVVSTADHEFFGVAMLEAVHCGCYPLCPNKLVYPEIFPKEYLYNTAQQLFKRLREYCRHPHLVRNHTVKVNSMRYSWDHLQTRYLSHLTSARLY